MQFFLYNNTYLLGEICCRFRCRIRGDVYYCSDRQPGCRRAATDYQRLDPDAEKGHWRFGDVCSELGDIPWRVWISDRQRQLLAGTWQDLPSCATGQRQAQSWGRPIESEMIFRNVHRLWWVVVISEKPKYCIASDVWLLWVDPAYWRSVVLGWILDVLHQWWGWQVPPDSGWVQRRRRRCPLGCKMDELDRKWNDVYYSGQRQRHTSVY